MIRGSDDGWSIVVDGFRVEQNRAIEGLFTLGSGYLHIRGSLEEHFDDDPQNVDFTRLPTNVTSEQFRATKAKWGTYVPGIYGKHPLLGNELINLPDFVTIMPFVDGGRLSAGLYEYTQFKRVLRLDCATSEREISLVNYNGKCVRIQFERFVSAARPHLCVQRVSIDVLRGLVHLQSWIDADVRTNGFDHLREVRFDRVNENTLRCDVTTDFGARLAIVTEMRPSGAEFNRNVPPAENSSGTFACDLTERLGTFSTRASSAGTTIRFEKRTAVSSSGDIDARDAREILAAASQHSYDELHAEHAAMWKEHWHACDVEIDGDPESQLAIRVALYHLIRCHVDDSRVAIDGKGYSGDAYWGRFFWDTELFLLPFYLYTAPKKARTLVDFRVNTLPGARRNAARYGYPGARYAWESDPEGDECCPNWQYADHEVHVTADVVYARAHFAAATGDESYLGGPAAEMLIDTARYWMGRVDRRASQPVLLGVMGPDEYTPISDNNAYTNRMVAFALNQAAAIAEHCSSSSGTPVTVTEIAAWREVAAKLPIPRHPDNPLLVLQCDGFESLAEPRFDEFWKDRDKTFASQVSQERLYRSKCLKQADVLMLMALFPHEFSDEEVRAAWDYYLPVTTHDSSLSPGVHALIACRPGLDDEAWRFWRRSCAVDLDIECGGAAEGVHIANFGAMWQIVVFGYAGVRTALQSEQLTLNPRLPKKWTALRFPLIWKGTPVRIEIQRTRVSVANRGERPIDVCVRDSARSIGPGTTEIWDIAP